MANTKKVLEEDFTKAPQAQTAEDVNNQDARTRLWQSLNTTYTNQMEESDKAYDKSISQQNNAMLARGMGRSSYAAQISANMYNDKNTARNKLGQALIADYQNRIGEIEAQEKEDERWQQQFDYQKERDTVADTQWQKQFEYQQGRDTVADQQWQKQYDEQLRQFNENMTFQKQRANVSDAQWQKTYDENLRQFNAQMAQQEAQFKANYDFQVSEANRQQSNWEIQQAFNEKQWQAQQEQWKQEFEYSKMSTDQKLAYETIMTIIGQGNDPSDDLLKRAGLSRADVNAMKAVAASSGGGYSPSSRPSSNPTTPTDSDVNDALGSSSNLKYIADVSHATAAGFKAGVSNTVGKDKAGTTSTSAAPFIAGASKAVINTSKKDKK